MNNSKEKKTSSKAFKVILLIAIIFSVVGIIVFCSVMGANDWDFGKLDPEKLEEKLASFSAEGITSIEVDIYSMNTRLEIGGEEVTLKYYDSDYYEYEFYTANSTLVLKEKEIFKAENIFLPFNVKRLKLEAVLTIPENVALDLSLKSTNSSFYLENLSFDSLSLSSTNGLVSLKNCNIQNLNITSINQVIEVEGLTAKTVSLKSTNAAIKLSNITAESLSVSSTTGHLECSSSTIDEISVKTETGDVSMRTLKTNTAYVTVTTGDVHLQIEGQQSDYSVTASATTGRVPPNQFGRTDKKLHLTTTTGDITLSFSQE